MKRFILTGIAIAGLGFAAACEHAPTDPNLDIEALIAASNPDAVADVKPISSTLPSLFREAIAKVEAEQGRVGVQAQLDEWRRLQDELKNSPNANRASVQANVEAIHTEELRVVLRVLGPSVLTRVMSDLNLGLADAQSRLAQAHVDATAFQRVTQLTQQIRQQTGVARAALISHETEQALDVATRAATLLSGLDYYLIELQRIDGIETLYPQAVEKIRSGDASAETQRILDAAEAANAAARKSLQNGNRDIAQTLLSAARANQIQVVLHVLGPSAATHLVQQIATRTAVVRDTLRVLDRQGQDVVRYQRMLAEATDLAKRAQMAVAAGDNATALDLGSHAAGLLNALQHLTVK